MPSSGRTRVCQGSAGRWWVSATRVGAPQADNDVVRLGPQSSDEGLAAERAVGVDGDAHAGRQKGQGRRHQRWLVSQGAGAVVGQHLPDQGDDAAPRGQAYDQQVVTIVEQHAVQDQVHQLAHHPGDGPA